MAYYEKAEMASRIEKVRGLLEKHDLDCAVVYYDECNLGNGWYLTAWCPQFESGAVLVPREGEPMILGGPESEPFAKQDSAITKTRNLPVFMVPDEEYPNADITSFGNLFEEISSGKPIKRVGIVGMETMPVSVYRQILDNFTGVELVDITDEFLKFRYVKSPWEIQQMRQAFAIADLSYDAMAAALKPGVPEYVVAAAGEYAARNAGANGFAFKTTVATGARSDAVVPVAMDKIMEAGEMALLGIAPRYKGYSGVCGFTLPVSGEFTADQQECMKHLKEVMQMTKDMLYPGKMGMEINAPGREYYKKHDLFQYLVCPFAHTIGIMEAEAPFFGPNSTDILVPGMIVSIDVSFFGHPRYHGVRIETCYEITEKGPIPMSEKMDKIFLG